MNKKQKLHIKEAFEIIKPYDNWFNNKGEKRNQEARKALYDFYKKLLKYKPSKQYETRDIWHTLYIITFVEIKKAFMEKKYMRVCNELISLMYYEPFLQGRIYYNILAVLKKELNIQGE